MSAVTLSRKKLHSGVGTSEPQCGCSLSRNLQPDKAVEAQATYRRGCFLRGLELYSEAAYV